MPTVNKPDREAHSVSGMNVELIEKKKLHDKLCSLVDKYKEMAKRMEGS